MDTTDAIVLAACGDIMLHGRYQDLAAAGRAHWVLAPLAGLLADADVVIGNLELPLAANGRPRPDKLCLRGDPAFVPALAAAGFDVLTLANNHCLDFGAEALAETRAHLAAAGIATTGAGADPGEAGAPVIIERNGLRIGLLAACDPSTKPAPPAAPGRPGVLPLDPDLLLPAIDALRPRVDHVLLAVHWGLEYSPLPTPEQVAFAHAACERGVSAILGHHSHCIQGIECYHGAVIAYSLANLTDDGVDWQGPTRHYQAPLTDVDRTSFLLRLKLTKDAVELLPPIPLWLDDDGRPTAAEGERAEAIRAQIDACGAQLAGTADLTAHWEQEVIARRVLGPLQSWWEDGSLWDKVRRFRPGQIVSAWLLLRTWLTVRFSRSGSRWLLFSERNDTRPMPAVREPRRDD